MAALTREERETCILINDLGEVTIWSISPMRTKNLKRRLGPPHEVRGETSFWNLTLNQVNVTVSKKRKGRPATQAQLDNLKKAHQARKDQSHAPE